MFKFFHGWRRKLGVVTLVLVLAIVASWVRSLVYDEQTWVEASGKSLWLQHYKGRVGIALIKVRDARIYWGWQSIPVEKEGFPVPYWQWADGQILIPHFAFVIPLTLLSAYLLLSKRRVAKPQSGPTQI